jgi:hypothetical protein
MFGQCEATKTLLTVCGSRSTRHLTCSLISRTARRVSRGSTHLITLLVIEGQIRLLSSRLGFADPEGGSDER